MNLLTSTWWPNSLLYGSDLQSDPYHKYYREKIKSNGNKTILSNDMIWFHSWKKNNEKKQNIGNDKILAKNVDYGASFYRYTLKKYSSMSLYLVDTCGGKTMEYTGCEGGYTYSYSPFGF